MTFTKADIKAIRDGRYKPCKLQKIIESFLKSPLDCAKIVIEKGDRKYKRPGNLSSAIQTTLKRMQINTIGVCLRNGEVYLYRKDVDAEE